MKFKEIKPGMVIHCPKEEDARVLLEYLDELGYEWFPSGKLTDNLRYERYQSDSLYCIDLSGKTILLSTLYATRPSCATPITEFSDLIEPDLVNEPENKLVKAPNTSSNALNDKSNAQMSAAEVLDALKAISCEEKGLSKWFDGAYSLSEVILGYSTDDIIAKITAYEAAKKAPKPVEVENGYYCKIYTETETVAEFTDWGIDEPTAKERAREIAIKHAEEWDEPTFVDVHFVCRVKEDK